MVVMISMDAANYLGGVALPRKEGGGERLRKGATTFGVFDAF